MFFRGRLANIGYQLSNLTCPVSLLASQHPIIFQHSMKRAGFGIMSLKPDQSRFCIIFPCQSGYQA